MSSSIFLDRSSTTFLSKPFFYSTQKSYPINLEIYFYCDSVAIFCSSKCLRACWSVLILKVWPSKYGFHLATTLTRARSTFLYVESNKALPFQPLRQKAIDYWSYIKIAPKPTPETSYLVVNSLEKSSNLNIRGWLNAFFKAINGSTTSLDH